MDLFFALSGFLITGILLRTRERPRYWRDFAIRRALRILPLYAFVLSLVGLSRLIAGVPLSHGVPAWTYALFVSNWWTAGAGFDDLTLAVTWSLAIEEQFYLVWPFAVRWLPRRALVGVAILAILLAPIARWAVFDGDYVAPYVLTPGRLDVLAAGALGALVGDRLSPRVSRALLAVAGAALTAWLVIVGADRADPRFVLFGYSVLALACGALVQVVGTAASPGLARALSSRLLAALGRVSFGVYLLHIPAIILTKQVLEGLGLSSATGIGALAYVAVAPALAIAMAVLTWRTIEAPALAYKDVWSPRLAPRVSS